MPLRPFLISIVLLMTPHVAPAQTSVTDAFARMAGHEITGATIITHGFTLSDGGGGYMLPLAEAIRDEIATQTGEPVWLLDYDLTDDGATGEFGAGSNLPPIGPTEAGHVVLLFDWGPESNEDTRWWAETAGDALFTLGTGLGIHDPRDQATAPVHFIAHSFGTVATTEAVERLAAYQVPVDQVTLIDPHDFDQADVPTYDDAQRMYELGAPVGYGATIWSNVAEADVYYQTRGNQDPLVSIGTADPEGRPVPGAYNRHLDGGDELPAGNPYGFGSLGSDHGYAWNTFYQSTVGGSLISGGVAPAGGDFDYTQTGWAHSIHNANRVPMPDAEFYGPTQDHEHSSPQLVTATGSPNEAGLAQLGLTSSQVTEGRFAPEFAPGDIVNGDFASGDRTSAAVDLVAGWSHHGGGGDSEINSEGGNRFMQLDSNDISRTHNYLYIPANAYELVYDFRVSDSSSDDGFLVLIDDVPTASRDLESTTGWITQRVPISRAIRDSVSRFGFELTFGGNFFDSPEVDIDNVRFAMATPVAAANVSVGGLIDLGNLFLGEVATLADALVIENDGHVESVLDLVRAALPDDGWQLLGLDSRVSLRPGDQAAAFDLLFTGADAPGPLAVTLELATNLGPLSWTVTAQIADRYAGDFNGDGVVDAADYTVWRETLGSTTLLSADADRNGTVDSADYAIWRTQFGWTSPSSLQIGSPVPEPQGAHLLALAAVAGTLIARVGKVTPPIQSSEPSWPTKMRTTVTTNSAKAACLGGSRVA